MRRVNLVSSISVLVLLTAVFSAALNVPAVKCSGTIYIRADGSIDPPTAPISTVDNVTYTFVDNIYDEIVVERSNITINGNEHAVQGISTDQSKGIHLVSINNVTIVNASISGFYCGIWADYSSLITVRGNNVVNNTIGILFMHSNYSTASGNNVASIDDGIDIGSSNHITVSGNNVANTGVSIFVIDSTYNSISGNNITESELIGISLTDSAYNSISGNNIITSHWYGIDLVQSSSNRIFHNNLINNTVQARSLNSANNVWDDGYPSGGNYWSDYNGADFCNGPSQNLAGSDRIGDTPVGVGPGRDRYPLIYPYGYVPSPDLNGDRQVDGKDVALVAKAFGSYPSHPRWNFRADLNQNSRIEGKDIAKIAKNFGTYNP